MGRQVYVSMNHSNNQKGYVLLLLVIIVASLSTTAIFTLSTITVNNLKTSRVTEKMYQAKALADGCVEVALQEIRDSGTISATSVLSFGEGSCEYVISSLGGDSREITGEGTVDDVVRKVRVTTNALNPQIIVNSWEEVSTF